MADLGGYIKQKDGKTRYCGPFQREWADLLTAKPKVVIDCGAYDGGDSVRFKEWWPKARVISIEPHPVLAKQLRAQKDKFEVHELALAATTGNAFFYFGDMADGQPGPSGSFFRISERIEGDLNQHRRYSPDPITVKTSRLDDFCRANKIKAVDILQMDGEGAEPDIVTGFGDLRPTIVMGETAVFAMMRNCPHTIESFRAQMAALGYREIDLGPHDIAWIHAPWIQE